MKLLKTHYGKKGSIEGSKTRLIKLQVSIKENKKIIRKENLYVKAFSSLHAAEKAEKRIVEKHTKGKNDYNPFIIHVSKIETINE